VKVLVACEFSQVVTRAFRERGHEAYSCDLLPTEGNPDWHIQDDVLKHLDDGWALMIAHPPCTYISYVGTKWWNDLGRCQKRLRALDFFRQLWEAPINKICLENPRGCASPTIAKYSQLINPYYFGDSYSKPTCLWLKNLPLLVYWSKPNLFGEKVTLVSKGEFVEHVQKNGRIKKDAKWYYEAIKLPPEERERLRSRTFPGIAKAMAEQWGIV